MGRTTRRESGGGKKKMKDTENACFETPAATIGIRGTRFGVNVGESSSR